MQEAELILPDFWLNTKQVLNLHLHVINLLYRLGELLMHCGGLVEQRMLPAGIDYDHHQHLQQLGSHPALSGRLGSTSSNMVLYTTHY